jgi:hypothetical protein
MYTPNVTALAVSGEEAFQIDLLILPLMRELHVHEQADTLA